VWRIGAGIVILIVVRYLYLLVEDREGVRDAGEVRQPRDY
jgi:hypothetical protein